MKPSNDEMKGCFLPLLKSNALSESYLQPKLISIKSGSVKSRFQKISIKTRTELGIEVAVRKVKEKRNEVSLFVCPFEMCKKGYRLIFAKPIGEDIYVLPISVHRRINNGN